VARLGRCPDHCTWVVLEGASAAGLHVRWPNESRGDSRLAGRGVRWREQMGDVGKGVARACVHGRVSNLASAEHDTVSVAHIEAVLLCCVAPPRPEEEEKEEVVQGGVSTCTESCLREGRGWRRSEKQA
jgi:hypothetical protein